MCTVSDLNVFRSRYAKDNFKSIPKANISIANDLRQSPVVNGKLFSMNGNSSKTLPAKVTDIKKQNVNHNCLIYSLFRHPIQPWECMVVQMM